MDKLLREMKSMKPVARKRKINTSTAANQGTQQKVVTQEEFIQRLKLVKIPAHLPKT